MEHRQGIPAEMLEHIENWKSSALSRQAYCRTQGLSYDKFYYYLKKHQGKGRPARRRGGSAEGGFVEVAVSGPVRDTGTLTAGVEVIRPDGTRIEFHKGVDVLFLKSLLN